MWALGQTHEWEPKFIYIFACFSNQYIDFLKLPHGIRLTTPDLWEHNAPISLRKNAAYLTSYTRRALKLDPGLRQSRLGVKKTFNTGIW